MSRTPAAELARVKVEHPQWSIRHVERGEAHRRTERGLQAVYAPTLAGLVERLAEAEAERLTKR